MHKTITLAESEVTDFICRQENHFFDRKSKTVDGKGIQKAISAFANADGGDVIIGIKDEKEGTNLSDRWDGFLKTEDCNFIFQNIQLISPTVPHTICYLQHPINKTFAIRITIDKSSSVHSTADGTVFIRAGAQSTPIKNPQRITELSYAKGESSYENMVLKDRPAEDIFESDEIKLFLNDYSPATSPIDFSLNQDLIDRKTFEPKIAGLLLFNDNPVAILPNKCGIKITRYDTLDIVPEREHLKDQITIEGSLYNQIQKAIGEISRIMSSISIHTPRGMEKVKYPPETIHEIVVNAVIHRDYSISDDIQIKLFNNRIEVISPGKLPGYVTVNNILDERFTRNSKIVRNLNRYKNAPNKDIGEGLNTAFQKMVEWQLSEPEIFEENNSVKVIISHTPLASPDVLILEYLNNNPKITNEVGRSITHIRSENRMKNVFYKLRDSGMIEPIMSKNGKKTVAWRLNADSIAPISQNVDVLQGTLF